MTITDIHIHILAGVDDGARNSESSERMLDIAYGMIRVHLLMRR